jgi:TolA-binding protein
MKKITIVICLLMLGACSQGKNARRDELPPVLTAGEIEALRQQPLIAPKENVLKDYEDFLNRYDRVDPDLRSHALQRLGDLYFETANRRFLEAMAAYENHPEGPPPLVDYGKAIETYRTLLRSAPNFRQNDRVLYALSRAYAETGDFDRAVETLERLIRNYPESPHRQEAAFRLGEYYFDRRQYERAAAAYEQSLALKDPFFLDKAQYKLGWTYFNMKDYPGAIDNFLRLVDQKATPEGDLPSDPGSLVWEAMTYVATSFRILGGAVPLSAYFQAKGSPPYERELYLMIGNQYMSDGDPGAAIETYRMFVRRHPLHPMAPLFSSYIMEAYEKQKERSRAEEARIRLVGDYSSKSPWYRANDDEGRSRARPIVKAALYQLALSSHSRAQKTRSDGDYRKASDWYRQFLSEFPRENESPDVHLFLAETLFELKEYSQAGAQYEAAAYGFPKDGLNPKAAYDAVVAYEKLQSEDGDRRVIDLSKRFAAAFPNDPKSPALLLKSGEILFEAGRYDEVLPLLEGSLARYPGQEGSATARKLIAHSYMRTGNLERAGRAYRRALDSIPTTDAKSRRELTDLLAAVLYKQADNRKRENRLEDAARLFEEVVNEAPDGELAPTALFEAGRLYEELNQIQKAIATYRRLVLLKPNPVLSGQARVQLGLLYEKEGEWIQAADAYTAAAPLVQDESLASHLLFTAGLYYEKGGQWDGTYDTFRAFTRRFPQDPAAPEALFKMARVRQNQRKVRESLQLFDQVVRKYPESPYAGEALFQEGEQAWKELKAVRLKEPLAKNLKKKTRAMEKAITLYRKAIETRFADVVTASTFRLGEIFEDFKSSLLNSEPPRSLTKEEREEYRFQLEEKAFPFEEKAIEAYSTNVRRVRTQNGPYDEWARKSYERLAELKPVLFKRPERAERIIHPVDEGEFRTQIPEDPQGRLAKARP